MTSNTDVVNLSLQKIGTRTTVTDAELAGNLTNEAIQANLILTSYRDRLLRMAPWNGALKTANLTYITSAPGTPENTSAPTTLWQPGQPAPPWAYEYQYPVDCLAARWMIPATQTGFAGGIPITTAVTGGAASFWQGPPVKFVVQNDQFIPVTGLSSIATPGTGYAVGDVVTFASVPNTSPPIGAPAQVTVLTVNGSGGILSAKVINTVANSATVIGGSYFAAQTNPIAQGSTTGSGSGATFNVTFGSKISQRVILTNQEFATLVYVQQITDPNLMDISFIEAWSGLVGAGVCMALTGDKKLANFLIGHANQLIMEARVQDANEGLTVNDVTPDWIRFRGIEFPEPYSGPYAGIDYGGLWTFFG